MGLSRVIHLEPFIKIPIQYGEYERVIKTCGEHESYRADKFCPICGKEIKPQKITAKAMLWNDDLIGNDHFYHCIEDEIMYLFSNYKNEYDINTDENAFTVVTPELITSMITEFSEKHKDDIKLLEDKIKMNVVVEFGFLYEVS